MPRSTPPHKSTSPPWTVIVIGAVALLTLTGVIWMIATRTHETPPDEQALWEAEHRQDISRLNDDAETLALQGNLKEAHAKYQEVARLVAGRRMKDTALAELVATARRNQDQIYQKLLASVSSSSTSPQPVAPPPVAPAVATAVAPPASLPAVADVSAQPMPPPDRSQFAGVPQGPVSDQQIGDAIQRGVDFLLSQFQDGEYRPQDGQAAEGMRQGTDVLCVYALATASKAIVDQRLGPKSPEMIRMLEVIKSYKLSDEIDNVAPRGNAAAVATDGAPSTYARALRACALATFNRPQDRKVLQADVTWLIEAATDGSYTYGKMPSFFRDQRKAPRAAADGIVTPDRQALTFLAAAPIAQPRLPVRGVPIPPPSRPGPLSPQAFPPMRPPAATRPFPPSFGNLPMIWDNSNSQYGLLGVWAGAEVGIEVPTKYWRDVEKHWVDCQLPSGEWTYMQVDPRPSYSMTCAGVASLLVTHDYVDAPLLGRNLSPQPYSSNLQKGIQWLEEGDHSTKFKMTMWNGYSLYGMERVGLASGYKYFGEHNWFVELAQQQLPRQQRDGAFAGAMIETAYTLLFLSRGRHPIIANKLRFDGYWTNRPRDLANLASYASKEMERPVNWQVVDAQREPEDWADAPILYIASHQELKFDDALVSKLAGFVANGGIIFTHADANSTQFTQSVENLAHKMFPSYPLRDLPTDHALFTLNYKIATPRPRLQGVTNGYRLLLVHSPSDLSDAWQTRATLSRKEAFQLGTNLYLYATGKEKFRNRLDTPIIPPPDIPPIRTIAVARLKHAGNWNPEPGAWPRFARKLQWDSGVELKIAEVSPAELRFDRWPLAHLTGTDALKLSDAESAALKRFIEEGGTLVVDAAGGSGEFADSASACLANILGAGRLHALEPSDRLLHHAIDGTVDAPAKTLRLYALERLGTNTTRVQTAALGKGRVIFSACDIATGLLGTNTWAVLGYLPEYSEALMKNIVLTSVH